MHAGGLEGPWVHGFERVAMAAARTEPKHSAEYILSTGVVFSQYLTILSHFCRVNTLLCRRIGRTHSDSSDTSSVGNNSCGGCGVAAASAAPERRLWRLWRLQRQQ